MSEEFCVVCGRSDRPLVESVCADCFAASHPLVRTRPSASLTICPTCGARKVGEHWERAGASELLSPEDLLPLLEPHPDVAIRRIHWSESGVNPLLRNVEGTMDVRFRGTERKEHAAFEVRIRHHTCPDCSRRSGRYFTAILQLRGPEGRLRGNARALRERIAEAWDRIVPDARLEWRKALSWREERPEGWDLYLTDTIAARSLAHLAKARLGAKVKESPSLYGRKDGRELYRVTFSVRIPFGPDSRPANGRPRGRSAPAAAPVER